MVEAHWWYCQPVGNKVGQRVECVGQQVLRLKKLQIDDLNAHGVGVPPQRKETRTVIAVL